MEDEFQILEDHSQHPHLFVETMPNIQQQSLQSLLLKMRFNGQELSTGTGFVVETAVGPVLITNRHNVTGRHQETGELLSKKTGAVPNEMVIVHNQQQNDEGAVLGSVERLERLLSDEEAPLWREHPTLGARADFVALPLTQLDGVGLFPYNVRETGPRIAIAPTETVSVIGFPFGKTAGAHLAVWATGFVASEPAVDYMNLPIMLIDCRTRQGQSGSPVIAFRNGSAAMEDASLGLSNGPMQRFVGIYSGRIRDESDIGMVWKASAIRELIDSFNPPVPNYRIRNSWV